MQVSGVQNKIIMQELDGVERHWALFPSILSGFLFLKMSTVALVVVVVAVAVVVVVA